MILLQFFIPTLCLDFLFSFFVFLVFDFKPIKIRKNFVFFQGIQETTRKSFNRFDSDKISKFDLRLSISTSVDNFSNTDFGIYELELFPKFVGVVFRTRNNFSELKCFIYDRKKRVSYHFGKYRLLLHYLSKRYFMALIFLST